MPTTFRDYGVQVPNYDVGGLVKSYGTTGQRIPTRASNLRTYEQQTQAEKDADYPQWSIDPATNKSILVSASTGKPFSGKIPQGVQNAGQSVQNGVLVEGDHSAAAEAAKNPPLPQFTVQKTVKQPEIAGAVTGLLKTQQAQSGALNKSFTDYLAEARDQAAKSKSQLVKDQAAFDTSGVEKELRGINRDYQTNQEGITADQVRRNAAYAGMTADELARLDAENVRYEGAAQAVAGQAVSEANKRINLYQLASGTPTSMSGDLINRGIKAYSDINIPLQRELSARRYGQITDIERPWMRENYGNDMGVLSRRSGLEGDYLNHGTDTAKYLQSLKMQVAGMARAQAESYLASLRIPFEVGQRIIAGDIANLTGIQGLDERANYYNLAKLYDPHTPQIPFYSAGGLPNRNYEPNDVRTPNNPVVPNTSPQVGSPLTAGTTSSGWTPNPVGWDTDPVTGKTYFNGRRWDRSVEVTSPITPRRYTYTNGDYPNTEQYPGQ